MEVYQIVTIKKLSIFFYFQTFSAKCHKYKIQRMVGHGRSRNGQGKVRETYFVKSVGTLHIVIDINSL